MTGPRTGPRKVRGDCCRETPRVCLCMREIGERDIHLLAYNPNAGLMEQAVYRVALTHNGDPHPKDVFLAACAELYDLLTGEEEPSGER